MQLDFSRLGKNQDSEENATDAYKVAEVYLFIGLRSTMFPKHNREKEGHRRFCSTETSWRNPPHHQSSKWRSLNSRKINDDQLHLHLKWYLIY